MFEKYGQGILSSLNPVFLKGSKVKDKNNGVPTNKELAVAGVIVYRKDIADELGFDMSTVKTIEDLDAVYKIVKEKRADMVPLYMQMNTFASHFLTELDYLGDLTMPGKANELANATSLPHKLGEIPLTGKTVSTGETAGSRLCIRQQFH